MVEVSIAGVPHRLEVRHFSRWENAWPYRIATQLADHTERTWGHVEDREAFYASSYRLADPDPAAEVRHGIVVPSGAA